MDSCDPMLISKRASPQGGRTYGEDTNCKEADMFCRLERRVFWRGGVLMVLQDIFLCSFFLCVDSDIFQTTSKKKTMSATNGLLLSVKEHGVSMGCLHLHQSKVQSLIISWLKVFMSAVQYSFQTTWGPR